MTGYQPDASAPDAGITPKCNPECATRGITR
jgi:hypothetical protein